MAAPRPPRRFCERAVGAPLSPISQLILAGAGVPIDPNKVLAGAFNDNQLTAPVIPPRRLSRPRSTGVTDTPPLAP